jgi:hypothetical protein
LDEKIDETFFNTVKWLRYSALKWIRGLGMNRDSLSDGGYLPLSYRTPKDVPARKALRKISTGRDSACPGDVGGRFLTRTGLQGNDRE